MNLPRDYRASLSSSARMSSQDWPTAILQSAVLCFFLQQRLQHLGRHGNREGWGFPSI